MASLAGGEEGVNVIYAEFSKAFGSLPYSAIAEMRGGWSGKEVVRPPKSVGPTCVGEDAEVPGMVLQSEGACHQLFYQNECAHR